METEDKEDQLTKASSNNKEDNNKMIHLDSGALEASEDSTVDSVEDLVVALVVTKRSFSETVDSQVWAAWAA